MNGPKIKYALIAHCRCVRRGLYLPLNIKIVMYMAAAMGAINIRPLTVADKVASHNKGRS